MVDGNTYPPTPEQQEALDIFSTRKPLRIAAGAGTGKTTTLAMCARSTPRIGTYLAFNKEIARDAEQAMPNTVACRTVHSVAARLLRQHHPEGNALLNRLGAPRMAPWKMAKRLRLGALIVQVPTGDGPGRFRPKVIQPNYQASLVMRAASVFCNSADPEPGEQHFPYVDGIDPMVGGRRTYVNNRQVARALLPALRRAWADLTSATGELRFFHDVYLKMAALGGYPIPGEYLLFDEAQDASPVMLGWLAAQQDAQVVYVGDSNQQIYEWRGAVDALALLGDDIPTAYLTQSWRFGPPVADVANLVLDVLHADLRLRGTPSIESVVYPNAPGIRRPRAVLCRSNAAAVQQVLNFQERGMAPHLVGGADDLVWFAEAAARLQAGEAAGHPELSCFDNWREVQQYVEDDPGGGDLRMLVNLIDSYGTDIVIEALSGLLAQEEADVVVSTAHKAKGREWESVRLAPDFEPPDGGELGASEWRLLYVAATRATHHLDVSACLPLRELLGA